MKIEEERNSLLLDYEVLRHLDSIKQSRVQTDLKHMVKSGPKSENLETILIELHAYLRDRPAGNGAKPQDAESIDSFVREIKRFELEKAEVLQLINITPQSLPVLYNVIEECDQRFSNEEMDEILRLVGEYLGFEPQPQPENGNEEDQL